MIRAIIFDFNGIFVSPVEDTVLAKLARHFHTPLVSAQMKYLMHLKKFQEGKTDPFVFWKKIFPALSKKEFRAIVENEYKKIRKHHKAYELAKNLSKQFKVYCLSNSNGLQEKHFKKKGLYSCFDWVFLSHRTGSIKPFPSAFRHVLSRIKLKAQECIFIDDSAKNILAAKTLGFKAIKFSAK